MHLNNESMYKALDAILIFLACVIAYWLRFSVSLLSLEYLITAILLTGISLLTLSSTGFYFGINSQVTNSKLSKAFTGILAASFVTATLLYSTKTGENYSRIWLFTSALLAYVLICSSRAILQKVFQASLQGRAIALLGNDSSSIYLSRKIENELEGAPIKLVRFFQQGVKSKEDLITIAEEIELHRCDPKKKTITELWITHNVFSQIPVYIIEQAFENTALTIVYIPEMPNLGGSISNIDVVYGIPTINSKLTSADKFSALIKLIIDQFVSWCTVLFLSPLLVLICIAIKLDSKGPIIYKQKRHGLGGQEFTIFKFRTMNVMENSSDFIQTKKEDPRITKVGKILRKTSLDELPQVANVINGTMSIVGPRPHPVKLNDQFREQISFLMKRHKLKPGITGLAQIKGYRGETTEEGAMENRIKFDLEYVNNWSLTLDIKIIFLTVLHLIKSENAY